MQSQPRNDSDRRLEIERVFLLRALPDLPAIARRLRIEQGYLPKIVLSTVSEGRLRRTTLPDGDVIFHHTVKRGTGMVRQETEREISREEFEHHWPDTFPLRLSKSRYEIPDSGLIWQIDLFDRPEGLVMAEVELPSADTPIIFPPWLAGVVICEVTDDPSYRNSAIAKRLAREDHM